MPCALPGCLDPGPLFRPERGEWLAPQHVEAGEHPDGGDENGGRRNAAEMLSREEAPWDVERVAADAPCQRHGAERSDETGQESEDTVLEEQHPGDGTGVGAERLED